MRERSVIWRIDAKFASQINSYAHKADSPKTRITRQLAVNWPLIEGIIKNPAFKEEVEGIFKRFK